MPKELRRRIFYTFIGVFLILGTLIVLYAQGWRLAFEPFGVGKVGGIYLRTFPANAEVKLDGKIRNRDVGIFQKGTLLNDILPGEYELKISAEGFQAFAMPVVVSSSLVTNMQEVVLVPTIPVAVTSTPVKNVALAGTTLVLTTASGTETLAGLPLKGNQVLAGAEDGTVILTYTTSTRSYYAADIPRATSTNLGRLAGQVGSSTLLSFQPIPRDDTLFLSQSSSSLQLLRVPSGEARILATTSVTAAAASGRVVWATFDSKTNASLFSAYDILSQNLNTNFEFVPGKVVSVLLREGGDIFALTNDGSLYSLSLNQSSRVRLTQNVRDMILARGGDKLAVLTGQGLEVFSLRNNQPNLAWRLPATAQAQKLTWYRDGAHLFVHYPDHVSFLDLKDITLKSFITVATTTRAEYEPSSNTLYFLKENTLYRLEFPSI